MKRKLLCIAVLLTALWAAAAWAEPAPFGLELRKTTLKEVKKRFDLKFVGKDAKYGWSFYDVKKWDVEKLGFDGLRGIKLDFDRNGKLIAVLCLFVKPKAKELFGMLKEKYRLVYKEGNPDEPIGFGALFDGGNKVRIVLKKSAKPYSTLLYICQEYSRMLRKSVAEDRAAQRKREKDLL
ncbi:MAG: hypothetical protein DRG55_06565 [Deltaproteobacteria bacterium]|nr:MAG: hypothetical protein DRG55_06565 [Deltaproteobacteria bacterium]